MTTQSKIAILGLPTDEALDELQKNLSGLSPVSPVQHRLTERFVLILREHFLDMPLSLMEVANKSNWTYHTAFKIGETARLLGLKYIFETAGKLDALIETPEERPQPVLFAEWESDYRSVFGASKELDKLWKGTSKKRDTDALLLTYCPVTKYDGFIRDVVQFWQARAIKAKFAPTLYLIVALTKLDGRVEQLTQICTLEILSSEVRLWDTLGS